MAAWNGREIHNTNSRGRWNVDEERSSQTHDSRRTTFNWRSERNWNGSRNDGAGMAEAGSWARSETRKRYEENTRRQSSLKIPAWKVGKVIGKHGSKIKELQSATGAYINIGEEDNAGKVEIIISGSLESQEKCKEMILKLTSDPFYEPSCKKLEVEAKKEEDTFCYVDWDAVRQKADEWEKNRWLNLPPLKKDFYIEAPEVAAMSEEYVEELKKSLNNITTTLPFGGAAKIPNPVETFDQVFAPYPELLEQLIRQQFTKPFPIQCQAWPILLSGHDMIGIAQTGTGKTLAFLLPAFIHTVGQEVPLSMRNGPNVLILAPTRELALQIDGEAKKFQYRGLKSVCLYGGGERGEQVRELEKGVNIVIATPGRLNDFLASGDLHLGSVTFLVLDEADRMLDMGFERQIMKILLGLRPDKQTVMTSATWPYTIQNLARKYMREPIKVLIGSTDLTAVHTVRQTVYIVREENKFQCLMDVISNMSPKDKVIVFVGRRAVADSLACDLILKKIECQSIHGNRVQSDREQAIEDLRTGAVRILVATDVASRGLDIVDITKVINYDFPRNIEEYVHRVGRTGRAGKTGEAISFFNKYNQGHAKELISILEEANQVVPEELRHMSQAHVLAQEKMRNDKYSGRGGRNFAYRGYGNE